MDVGYFDELLVKSPRNHGAVSLKMTPLIRLPSHGLNSMRFQDRLSEAIAGYGFPSRRFARTQPALCGISRGWHPEVPNASTAWVRPQEVPCGPGLLEMVHVIPSAQFSGHAIISQTATPQRCAQHSAGPSATVDTATSGLPLSGDHGTPAGRPNLVRPPGPGDCI